jgi:hypothetical protein
LVWDPISLGEIEVVGKKEQMLVVKKDRTPVWLLAETVKRYLLADDN